MTTRSRLLDCFRAVFPDFSDEQLAAATTDNTPAWDSIALVTLVTLVEEEFGIDLPPDDYGILLSFDAFAARLAP